MPGGTARAVDQRARELTPVSNAFESYSRFRRWIRFWFLVIALSLEERPNRADRRLRHP
jgi:hypothetical protein